MDRRALLMYAFVKERFEVTGDIVSGLIPLFAPIVKKNAHKDFDSNQFVDLLNQYYGIRMHHYVAQDWAPRLAAAGLLHAVEGDAGVERYINLDPDLPSLEGQEKRVDEIFRDFREFCSPILKRHKTDISPESLDAALRKRLIRMEFLEIINTPDKNYSPDTTLRIKTSIADSEDSQLDPEAKIDVICAAFALHLHNVDPKKFDMLSEVAAGALISEVVLGLRVPPTMKDDLSSTQVSLDSPILIDLLDISSKEEKDSAAFIFDELKKLKAKTVTYDHCVDELQGVIRRVLDQRENRMALAGSVGRRVITDNNAVTRLRMLQKNVYREIERLGIEVIETDIEKEKYFPKNSVDDLVAKIRPHRNIDARIIDATSIAISIREMRAVRPVSNIFSASHIFISKNTGLIRTAYSVLIQDGVLQADQAPPFMTDRHLAGLLFIASGGAGSAIPARKLIANCAVAMRPRQDVVTKLYATLRELDPEQAEIFSSLMSDERCSYYLMEQSLGDADFTDKSMALDMLNEIREQTAYETEQRLRQEHSEETAARQSEFDKKFAELRGSELELKESLNESKQQIDELGERISQIDRQKEIAEKSIVLSACDKARITRFIWIIFVALLLAAISITGGMLASLETSWSIGIGIVGSAAASILQFWLLPGYLFGKFVRRRQLIAFQNALDRLEARHLEQEFIVDFEDGTAKRIRSLDQDSPSS